MSYDIEVGVKVSGTTQIIPCVDLRIPNPSYNYGEMFKRSMGWKFKQGIWYSMWDAMRNIEIGIQNLSAFDYSEYSTSEYPRGQQKRALYILKALKQDVDWFCEENNISYKYLWIRW